FSQMSIFSELNNLVNISMKPEFAAICGFTKEEILENMHDHLVRLAERQGITFDEAVNKLTETYDGYHFTWPSPDIFNPFSVLNCMSDCTFNYYWFASGTPTYLIEMMRKFDVAPSNVGRLRAQASAFDAPTERMTSLTPLLYQSGYLTIKAANKMGIYTLDIPNKEIRVGLMESLLPNYVMARADDGNVVVADMCEALFENNLETFFTLLRDFLLSIPYCENTHYEGHYQQMLYVILSLLGRYVDVEVRTNKGRIDLVMQAAGKLYLMELKVGQSAEAALQQIDLKQYPERFALSGLPIVRVGLNFDMETRTIADWQIIE
ncbi:MAG: AAA family ATPase, partial [Bacteroidales bacterium]|nr:AAA family ATPase [Bacteroidales bacterium]